MSKCKDCFWHRLVDQKEQRNGDTKGRCLAKSPSAIAVVMPVMHQITREVIPQIIEVTSWPLTSCNSESCGDFKAALPPLALQPGEVEKKRRRLI